MEGRTAIDATKTESYLSAGIHFFKKKWGSSVPESKKSKNKDVELVEPHFSNVTRLVTLIRPYFFYSSCLNKQDWQTFLNDIENEEGLQKILQEANTCLAHIDEDNAELVIYTAYFFHLNIVHLNKSVFALIKKLLMAVGLSPRLNECALSTECHLRLAEIVYHWVKNPTTVALILSHCRLAAYQLLKDKKSDLQTELQLQRAAMFFHHTSPHEQLFPKIVGDAKATAVEAHCTLTDNQGSGPGPAAASGFRLGL